MECDETEIGRRQKGVHSHKKIVKGDVWGAVERETGRVHLELFDKLKAVKEVERRFGPTVLFTDGARACELISKKLG